MIAASLLVPPTGRMLAHAGRFTWDELLYFAIPAAIFVIIRSAAQRRQRAAQAAADMLRGPSETKS